VRVADVGSAPRPGGDGAGSTDQADVIFYGGPILTVNDAAPRAEALAVRRGLISAVGTKDEVLVQQGPQTRIVNLDGHALLPGFIDPHMHTAFVYMDSWLDVGPFTTKDMDEAVAKVRAAVQQAAPGAWMCAKLIDPSIMPGKPELTVQDLDPFSPDNPVFILNASGHLAYVNSKAIEIAGVTRDTPDPPQGRFKRDANGNLTGVLEEPPAYNSFIAKMPVETPQEFLHGVRRLFDGAAAVGCTGLHDCGLGMLNGPQDVEAVQWVMREDPPIRYSAALVSTHMDAWVGIGLTPNTGNDRFKLTSIKLWADGSNQGLTGYQRVPYLHSTNRGALNYTLEQITDGMQTAHDLGWQISVHANGDAAIDTTLQAYETVLTKQPRTDHRHRIEHCSVLHPEQIEKMAHLGLSPSFLIGHVYYWGRAFRDTILGPERANLYDPCASALKGGLRISFHSDWNVTPIEPLRYIQNAVTRVMRDGGEVLNPAERVTAEQAIKAITLDAAWQCRMDDIAGSLEVGKRADLVVLEKDPTAVGPATIRSIAVLETWLDGARRYSA